MKIIVWNLIKWTVQFLIVNFLIENCTEGSSVPREISREGSRSSVAGVITPKKDNIQIYTYKKPTCVTSSNKLQNLSALIVVLPKLSKYDF